MKKFFGNLVNEIFIKLFYYKPYRVHKTIEPCGVSRTLISNEWERPAKIKWSHERNENE